MNEAPRFNLPGSENADQVPGLIFAYRALPGQPATVLAQKDIEAALAAGEGWVWLHVDLVDQRAHGWVGHACRLPHASRAILEGHDSLVLGHEDGVVHGVSADMHKDIERRSSTIGRLHFAVTERLLVTGRRHSLEGVDQLRRALGDGLRLATAFDLFEAIVGAFCKNTGLRLAEATRQLDEVEDNLVTERLSDERRRLKEVRRLAVSLHRPVSGMVALFEDEDRDEWQLSSVAHTVLQRLSARLERLDREIVMINDRARLLQEEMAAELADESNRSLKAMAVMSALLLPGTLVVGIFGMNTAGLPFTHTETGFLWAMGLGIGATALFYWLLRRAGISLRF